jgi:hypothetical protein
MFSVLLKHIPDLRGKESSGFIFIFFSERNIFLDLYRRVTKKNAHGQ